MLQLRVTEDFVSPVGRTFRAGSLIELPPTEQATADRLRAMGVAEIVEASRPAEMVEQTARPARRR